MGSTAGALGPAPTTAAEGPAAEEGPAAAMSAPGDLAATEEGPAAGRDGPWRTHGLKVWAPLVFAISGLGKEQLENKR